MVRVPGELQEECQHLHFSTEASHKPCLTATDCCTSHFRQSISSTTISLAEKTCSIGDLARRDVIGIQIKGGKARANYMEERFSSEVMMISNAEGVLTPQKLDILSLAFHFKRSRGLHPLIDQFLQPDFSSNSHQAGTFFFMQRQ